MEESDYVTHREREKNQKWREKRLKEEVDGGEIREIKSELKQKSDYFWKSGKIIQVDLGIL